MFEERDGMAERDALRIARDQIGKLNAQFNEERQTQLGVTQFVWRTANDSRVRDSHAHLEGEVFNWSDPPTDDETGETIIPGSAVQCRCYGEPVFDQILEGL
jgi:SPP1 gp7 family putative phage head morphogenesis protein